MPLLKSKDYSARALMGEEVILQIDAEFAEKHHFRTETGLSG